MATDREAMRIRRLERRVARLERGLELLKHWDARKYQPLRPFITEILDEDSDATDEEIVDALVEKVDELLKFEGLVELITDVGIRLVAEVGLWVHQNRERLLTQRLARLRKRIAQLEKALPKKAAKKAGRSRMAKSLVSERAIEDEQAIFAELGMNAKFLEALKPTRRKTRAKATAR
jgi:hypothetical protein